MSNNTLNIELSNRCVLACPACPRTWFHKTFNRPVPRQDLDINLLHKFLDCSSGERITHFHLESNHGDSIYSPKLLELIDTWRDTKTFHIVTNGSRMPDKFWKELNARMTENDQITFSIDGLEDTNHIYRINSHWPSIMSGFKHMVESPAWVSWKTIIFSYNQHQIDEIKRFALESGADDFQSEMSHRFGDDSYKPTDQLIDITKLYDRKKDVSKIDPKCDRGQQLYISADGYAWPCCMLTSYFTLHKTDLWKQRKEWTIADNTLDSVLAKLETFVLDVRNNPNKSHSVCKMECGALDQ